MFGAWIQNKWQSVKMLQEQPTISC